MPEQTGGSHGHGCDVDCTCEVMSPTNGTVFDPGPAKLFVGMLSQDVSLFEEVGAALRQAFGPSDMESPVMPWDHTDYYDEEMGKGLRRKFVFFERLISPGSLSQIKLRTIQTEKEYAGTSGGRRINLDPGYVDSAKVVLASTKDYSHRIYLAKGIYAEVTLVYSGGDYRAMPYTFPDFRTPEYRDIFRSARRVFRTQSARRGRVLP